MHITRVIKCLNFYQEWQRKQRQEPFHGLNPNFASTILPLCLRNRYSHKGTEHGRIEKATRKTREDWNHQKDYLLSFVLTFLQVSQTHPAIMPAYHVHRVSQASSPKTRRDWDKVSLWTEMMSKQQQLEKVGMNSWIWVRRKGGLFLFLFWLTRSLILDGIPIRDERGRRSRFRVQ